VFRLCLQLNIISCGVLVLSLLLVLLTH